MQQPKGEIRSWAIRPSRAEGIPFLRAMLYAAAFWRTDQPPPITQEAALAHPEIGRYIRDWGRVGDTAFVAEDANARQIGAAWFHLFTPDEPGYGFIDAYTPEMTIAVVSEWRGKGVGRNLLTALLEAARALGFIGLSLSVSRDNPAVALYQRCGFVRVGETNGSWTMCADLRR